MCIDSVDRVFINQVLVLLAAVYTWSTTLRWRPPKPQLCSAPTARCGPRSLAMLAPCGPCVAGVRRARLPLWVPSRPHRNRTSLLPNLVAGAVGASDSLAPSVSAPFGPLTGARHRTAAYKRSSA